MIGRVLNVSEGNGGVWSVETLLHGADLSKTDYRLTVRMTPGEMERTVSIMGVEKPRQIVDADFYIEGSVLDIPAVYVLVNLDGKYWNYDEVKEGFIGRICETSIVNGKMRLSIQSSTSHIWCTCELDLIKRIEKLEGGENHATLVGKRVVYFTKPNSAYIAIKVK